MRSNFVSLRNSPRRRPGRRTRPRASYRCTPRRPGARCRPRGAPRTPRESSSRHCSSVFATGYAVPAGSVDGRVFLLNRLTNGSSRSGGHPRQHPWCARRSPLATPGEGRKPGRNLPLTALIRSAAHLEGARHLAAVRRPHHDLVVADRRPGGDGDLHLARSPSCVGGERSPTIPTPSSRTDNGRVGRPAEQLHLHLLPRLHLGAARASTVPRIDLERSASRWPWRRRWTRWP